MISWPWKKFRGQIHFNHDIPAVVGDTLSLHCQTWQSHNGQTWSYFRYLAWEDKSVLMQDEKRLAFTDIECTDFQTEAHNGRTLKIIWINKLISSNSSSVCEKWAACQPCLVSNWNGWHKPQWKYYYFLFNTRQISYLTPDKWPALQEKISHTLRQ